MKSVFQKIRLPRKVMFIAGVLVLCGASGAFALYAGQHVFLGASEPEPPSLSGLACTAIETLKLRRNGQRWIRKYVSTESADGVDRVRTALRVAGLLAKDEKADLYQVVVLDQAGPKDRAERRGPAIGAEVLFAPDPSKLPGMSTPFVARYNDGKANTIGLFYGREVALSTDDIKTTLTAMDEKSDCMEPVAVEGEPGAEGSDAGAHGEKPASDHGAEAVTDHEAAPSAHGDEEAAPAHGVDAPAGHDVVKAEEKGFFGSMIDLVLGEDDKPVDHPQPAASGHDADAAILPAHDAAPHDVPVTSDHEKQASGHGEDHGDQATTDPEAASSEHGDKAFEPAHEEAPPAHEEDAPAGHGADAAVLPAHDAAPHNVPVTLEHEKPVEAEGHKTSAAAH